MCSTSWWVFCTGLLGKEETDGFVENRSEWFSIRPVRSAALPLSSSRLTNTPLVGFTDSQKEAIQHFAPSVSAPSKPSRAYSLPSAPSSPSHPPRTPPPQSTRNRSLSSSPPPITPTRSRLPGASRAAGIVSLSAFANEDAVEEEEEDVAKRRGDIYPPSPPHYRSLPARKTTAEKAKEGETTRGAAWLSAASSVSATPAMVVSSKAGSGANGALAFSFPPLSPNDTYLSPP
jgi:hypothetical protein